MYHKMIKLYKAGIIVLVFMMLGNFCCFEKVEAAQLQEEMQQAEEVVFQLVAYDKESNRGLAIVRIRADGVVSGDGVRLRSTPSSSGTILEKMYNGEYVTIMGESNGWYNLQRMKTGTVGWASKDYIRIK